MPQKYLNKILNTRVYDVAIESPLDAAPGLSLIKCEFVLQEIQGVQ